MPPRVSPPPPCFLHRRTEKERARKRLIYPDVRGAGGRTVECPLGSTVSPFFLFSCVDASVVKPAAFGYKLALNGTRAARSVIGGLAAPSLPFFYPFTRATDPSPAFSLPSLKIVPMEYLPSSRPECDLTFHRSHFREDARKKLYLSRESARILRGVDGILKRRRAPYLCGSVE